MSKVVRMRSRSLPSEDVPKWIRALRAKGVQPAEFLEQYVLSKLTPSLRVLYLRHLALATRGRPASIRKKVPGTKAKRVAVA